MVLDGNGDFFHKRAVWVTFAESKVTKQEVFDTAMKEFRHCGVEFLLARPKRNQKRSTHVSEFFKIPTRAVVAPSFAQQRGGENLF